jgi:hypothetical protein
MGFYASYNASRRLIYAITMQTESAKFALFQFFCVAGSIPAGPTQNKKA